MTLRGNKVSVFLENIHVSERKVSDMGKQLEVMSGPDRLTIAFSLLAGENSKTQWAAPFVVRDPTDTTGHTWVEYIKVDTVQRKRGKKNDDGLLICGFNTANNASVSIDFSMRTRIGTMTFG